VNDYRPVGLVVGSGVFQLEAFGHDVIYLHGAELPFSAYCIFYDKIYFRSVKCGFADGDCVIEINFVGSFFDFSLSTFPKLNIAAVLEAFSSRKDNRVNISMPKVFEKELD